LASNINDLAPSDVDAALSIPYDTDIDGDLPDTLDEVDFN
jgi:hypothetical protein